jgi:hypothetical protein
MINPKFGKGKKKRVKQVSVPGVLDKKKKKRRQWREKKKKKN